MKKVTSIKKNLFFVGSNGEKFNFNILKTPLDFLLNFYNQKITLKEAEFIQESLNKFNYKPNNVEEEEINSVLMQANELLIYRDIII